MKKMSVYSLLMLESIIFFMYSCDQATSLHIPWSINKFILGMEFKWIAHRATYIYQFEKNLEHFI